MKGVTLAWLTVIGIGTYRWESSRGAAVLPPPALYVGPALAFTIIGLAGEVAPKPAALFAWGMVIAAAVNGDFGRPPTAATKQTAKARTTGKTPAAKTSGKG